MIQNSLKVKKTSGINISVVIKDCPSQIVTEIIKTIQLYSM